jgi:hypothetical protein
MESEYNVEGRSSPQVDVPFQFFAVEAFHSEGGMFNRREHE